MSTLPTEAAAKIETLRRSITDVESAIEAGEAKRVELAQQLHQLGIEAHQLEEAKHKGWRASRDKIYEKTEALESQKTEVEASLGRLAARLKNDRAALKVVGRYTPHGITVVPVKVLPIKGDAKAELQAVRDRIGEIREAISNVDAAPATLDELQRKLATKFIEVVSASGPLVKLTNGGRNVEIAHVGANVVGSALARVLGQTLLNAYASDLETAHAALGRTPLDETERTAKLVELKATLRSLRYREEALVTEIQSKELDTDVLRDDVHRLDATIILGVQQKGA